jgi:hypothetical protein
MMMAIIIVIVTGASAFSIWLNLAGRSASTTPEQAEPLVQPVRSDEPLTVTLFVSSDGFLSTGSIAVKRQPDTQAQAREVLTTALADLRAAQSPVLRELKLRGLFIDGGTAYVDLAPLPQTGIRSSALEELLAIYAIVNTLGQNFEEIMQVRFLVDGKEAQTLAGHIDLSRTFTKRNDLVKQ